MMTLADTLRAFRSAVGWRQIDMADAIPVSLATYKRWERGTITRFKQPLTRQRVKAIFAQHDFDPRTGLVRRGAADPDAYSEVGRLSG